MTKDIRLVETEAKTLVDFIHEILTDWAGTYENAHWQELVDTCDGTPLTLFICETDTVKIYAVHKFESVQEALENQIN